MVKGAIGDHAPALPGRRIRALPGQRLRKGPPTRHRSATGRAGTGFGFTVGCKIQPSTMYSVFPSGSRRLNIGGTPGQRRTSSTSTPRPASSRCLASQSSVVRRIPVSTPGRRLPGGAGSMVVALPAGSRPRRLFPFFPSKLRPEPLERTLRAGLAPVGRTRRRHLRRQQGRFEVDYPLSVARNSAGVKTARRSRRARRWASPDTSTSASAARARSIRNSSSGSSQSACPDGGGSSRPALSERTSST